MTQRYRIRFFRIFILLLIIFTTLFWFISLIKFNFNRKSIRQTISYGNILDNHIYPPPWFISNWTINDYFIRKDQYAIDQKQKIFLHENQIIDKRSSYTILEYTKVFSRPKILW